MDFTQYSTYELWKLDLAIRAELWDRLWPAYLILVVLAIIGLVWWCKR